MATIEMQQDGRWRTLGRNYTELDAMKDAQQMARTNLRALFVVSTNRGKHLIQYGPNDRVKRINWS